MGKYKSVNTGDYKAMASVETKQKESNMVTTMETKQSENTGVVRQVKKYIHNKNTYLQSEIDNKYTPKRTTPLSYSEREYVEKLKSQLRDEAPIDKLLESLESKENQWGEPDPLDESDNLFEEDASDDFENQESNGVA